MSISDRLQRITAELACVSRDAEAFGSGGISTRPDAHPSEEVSKHLQELSVQVSTITSFLLQQQQYRQHEQPIKINLAREEHELINAFSTPGITSLNLPSHVVTEADVLTMIRSERSSSSLSVLICDVNLSIDTQEELIRFLRRATPNLQALHVNIYSTAALNQMGRWLQTNPSLQVLSLLEARQVPVEFASAMRVNTKLRRLYLHGGEAENTAVLSLLQHPGLTHLATTGRCWGDAMREDVVVIESERVLFDIACQRLRFIAESKHVFPTLPLSRCRRCLIEHATYDPHTPSTWYVRPSTIPSLVASGPRCFHWQLKEEVLAYMWDM